MMDKSKPKTIGRNLRKIRELNGWSQAYLADQLQLRGTFVSKEYLAKLEIGLVTTIPNETIQAISDVFDVPSWSLEVEGDLFQEISKHNLEKALGNVQPSQGIYSRSDKMVKARSSSIISEKSGERISIV